MKDELDDYLIQELGKPGFARNYARAEARGRWRDNLAMLMCNWILHTIATRWYCDRIDQLIRLGLLSAAVAERLEREEKEHGTPGI